MLLVEPSAATEVATWVERFAGWGVVLLIVKWMMARADRQNDQTDKLVSSLQAAVAHFDKFQRQEDEVHHALIRTQEKILSELERIHATPPRS